MMHSWKSPRITITAIALFVLFSQQLMAQSEIEDDAWNHSLAVYLWGSSIKGTTAQGAEVDVTLPLSESGDVWDTIVGLRGNISLGPRRFVPWGANIGAGDSDLTWQAMAGVGYKAASCVDVVLTYRYLKWELDGELIDELSFSGPLLGAVFRF